LTPILGRFSISLGIFEPVRRSIDELTEEVSTRKQAEAHLCKGPAGTMMSDITIILLFIWSLPWKGVALWRAAHRHDKWWFVVLLVVQTLGALEILYIFWLSKRESQAPDPPKPPL
jgi:hypothetical protein